MQFQRTYFFSFAKASTGSPAHITHSYFMVGGKAKKEKQCYLQFLTHGENCFSLEIRKGKSPVFEKSCTMNTHRNERCILIHSQVLLHNIS